jgi:quercetin 2,3-dioxygenase
MQWQVAAVFDCPINDCPINEELSMSSSPYDTVIQPQLQIDTSFQYLPADTFPWIHPIHWLHSHFAVGGWSPLQRLSGMLTAHMTRIAPQNGFTWHPHRGLEIYTWVLEGDLYHEDTTGGKGIIKAGELQRMFSGEWIEHQELNQTDDPVRVIQIWFAADKQYSDVQPHYQQLSQEQLPSRRVGDATVFSLIGDKSPMQQHVDARLTATYLDSGGTTTIEAPKPGEELFLYVTDGAGQFIVTGETKPVELYDVMLARPDMQSVQLKTDDNLRFLSFYLPAFLD